MPTTLQIWDKAQADFRQALVDFAQGDTQPPKAAVEMLKTKVLRENLDSLEKAKGNEDVVAARKAASKVQKFFLQYGTKFKAAFVATKDDDTYNDVHLALLTLNRFIQQTQVAAAQEAKGVLDDAKSKTNDQGEKLELDIKAALTPMRFKTDWKAEKDEFERATGKKKPSEKVMGSFRKSAGLDNALDDLDKACKDVKPDDYRKAYTSFVKQKNAYVKVLEAALKSDKAADETYERKCEALKKILGTIDTRAAEKIRLLDALNV